MTAERRCRYNRASVFGSNSEIWSIAKLKCTRPLMPRASCGGSLAATRCSPHWNQPSVSAPIGSMNSVSASIVACAIGSRDRLTCSGRTPITTSRVTGGSRKEYPFSGSVVPPNRTMSVAPSVAPPISSACRKFSSPVIRQSPQQTASRAAHTGRRARHIARCVPLASPRCGWRASSPRSDRASHR